MVRVGINGLGVMGRYLIRAVIEQEKKGNLKKDEVEIVAFNDLAPAEQLARLLEHDTNYRNFPERIFLGKPNILLDHRAVIFGYSEKDPADIPWGDNGVDVVYESTGAFYKKPGADRHLLGGAKKVIISAPSDFAQHTIVMGVNNKTYNGEDILSAASCTTNCLAPLALAVYKEFREHIGLMSTIHAYTGDQSLVDAPHSDAGRAYEAAQNIIPTSTGAKKAIGKVIPDLEGKMDGIAFRVPVSVGSVVDSVVLLKGELTPEQVNEAMQRQAQNMEGVFDYRKGPLVSSKVIGDPIPSIFDASQTRAVAKEDKSESLVKLVSWYDNVAGYSHQALKLIQMLGK